MDNNIQIFENSEFGKIRTLQINNQPYFVGKDVATVLGYSNPRKALLDHIDEEDKLDGVTIRDSIGREQKPVVINESGLYSLILSSKLPTAKKFKRWVTSEVLPAIRQNGYYTSHNNEDIDLTIQNRIAIAKLLATTPNSRLPLVQHILEPVIGDVSEFTNKKLSATVITSNKEITEEIFAMVLEILIDTAYNECLILKQDKNYVYINKDVFKAKLEEKDISYVNAMKTLSSRGFIKCQNNGNKKSLTVPVWCDGHPVRCVAISKTAINY